MMDARVELDEVVICPYDKNHKIARSRIQRHIVKCEKQYPVDYKSVCPYDATHRVFPQELTNHILSCPKRKECVDVYCSDTSNVPHIEKDADAFIKEGQDDWDDNETDRHSNDFSDFAHFNLRQQRDVGRMRCGDREKRYDVKLRTPFGYSESQMLELSNNSFEDDADSVCSSQAIGRGQNLIDSRSGQNFRGTRGSLYRRGQRGRY